MGQPKSYGAHLMADITYTNARIFDGEKFITATRLRILDGIIRQVGGSGLKIPPGSKVQDLKHHILTPGFIDLHAHGAGGVDSMEIKSPDLAVRLSKALSVTGVTSFLLACFYENNNSGKTTAAYFERAKGARFLGQYLEGPFINQVKRGMIPIRFLLDPGSAMKERAADVLKKYPKLKIMTIAPELANSGQAIKIIKKKGVVPAFGHSAAGYDAVKSALSSGFGHVTHLFNAMASFHHRQPGPFPAIAEALDAAVEIIADGVHVHPAAVSMAVKTLGVKRVILVTDSTAALGFKDGTYKTGSESVTIRNGAAFLSDGTLMGSCTTLPEMVRNVKKWCSLTNEDVLRMVTYNPAKILGFPRVGLIKPKFFADFNILDDNLKLLGVIAGGKQVFKT